MPPHMQSPVDTSIKPICNPPFKVLIFSRTAGYHHDSIPSAISALENHLAKSSASFTVLATEDPAIFDDLSALNLFCVIILLQTSGDFLSPTQLANFEHYFHGQGGRGVVGIHAASCGHTASDWYTAMIGAAFSNHPVPQTGNVKIVDRGHPVINGSNNRASMVIKEDNLDASDQPSNEWTWHDEFYNFKLHPRAQHTASGSNSDLRILMTVDKSSYQGGTHDADDDHPVAWCQEFETGARSYYTALGHFAEAYQDPRFLSQLLAGIMWTAKVPTP